jgi:hypothetical protein
MGSGTRQADGRPYKKEFWWEREWRHLGDFKLPSTFILLCPEDEIDAFNQLIEAKWLTAKCIDPRWSLEKIIARLVGFKSEDIEMV